MENLSHPLPTTKPQIYVCVAIYVEIEAFETFHQQKSKL